MSAPIAVSLPPMSLNSCSVGLQVLNVLVGAAQIWSRAAL